MPLLPYLDAGPTPSPPRVPQLATGQGGQALAAAFQDVARAGQQIFDAHQRAKMNRVLSESAIALGEAQDELQASGDFEGAEAAFGKAVAEQQARAKELRGEYAQEFEQRLKVLGAGETLRLRGWARQEAAGATRAETETTLQNSAARFADTGDTSFIDAGMLALEESGQAFTPEQLVAAREGLVAQAATDRQAVMRQRDPHSAEIALGTDPFYDQIPESMRAQLIEAAQAEQTERQRVALQQASFNDLAERRGIEKKNDENLNRVLEGTLSPEEVFGLDWGDARGREHGMEVAGQQLAAANGAPERVTDPEYARELYALTPEQLLAKRIDPMRLSPGDTNAWFKEQKSVREGKVDAGVYTIRDEAKLVWEQVKESPGFFSTQFGDLGLESELQFRGVVEARYAEFVTLKSRKPDTTERAEIIRSSVTTFNELVGGSPLPEPLNIPLSPDAMSKIREAITRQGLNPDDPENVRDMRELLGL